ncbi:hypothetical protein METBISCDRAFT_27249 [Metschnikowia bicuspidata]|uniref:Uncharacterized protein n=1 Tax=Metschnikowia bicuspidata TaxID=27322 RepID=A0A4P9ZEI7_9ASCO|nr:hypothetical protein METBISCDRAFT_27249 [Metschnikowia bicuspidata]
MSSNYQNQPNGNKKLYQDPVFAHLAAHKLPDLGYHHNLHFNHEDSFMDEDSHDLIVQDEFPSQWNAANSPIRVPHSGDSQQPINSTQASEFQLSPTVSGNMFEDPSYLRGNLQLVDSGKFHPFKPPSTFTAMNNPSTTNLSDTSDQNNAFPYTFHDLVGNSRQNFGLLNTNININININIINSSNTK